MAIPAAAAIIGGSLLSKMMSDFSSSDAYSRQSALMDKDFQFQREMWERNYQLWKENNQYNSPANQAKLMQQGGFSPSALFGQSGSFSSTPAQTGSLGAHGNMPVMTSFEQNPFLSVSSLAQALNSVSQSNKNMAELPVFDAQVKKLLKDADLTDTQNNLQKLYVKFENAYGAKFREGQIQKMSSEYINNIASSYLAIQRGDTEESVRLLNEAKKQREQALSKLTDAQREIVEIDARFEESKVMAEIESLRSGSVAAYAAAKRDTSQADINKQEARVRRAAADLKDATWSVELESSLNALIASSKLSQANEQEAKNKLAAISRMQTGSDVHKAVDDFLIWLKERSPFNISMSAK